MVLFSLHLIFDHLRFPPPPPKVDGWPEPELIWLVDDQPLRPSQDFRLQYDGQHAKLEIRDAQPDDTGTYAVRISNEYGSAVSQSQLTVAPDPDKNHVPPEFQASVFQIRSIYLLVKHI